MWGWEGFGDPPGRSGPLRRPRSQAPAPPEPHAPGTVPPRGTPPPPSHAPPRAGATPPLHTNWPKPRLENCQAGPGAWAASASGGP